MQNEYPTWFFSFSGALETEFVGREKLIREILSDLADPTPGPRVIALVSKGGYGKTFLLKKIIRKIRSTDQITQQNIIDLYHLTNHTPDFLTHNIIKSLKLPSDINLAEYEQEWSKLKSLRIKNDIESFNRQSETTLTAFLEIMQVLSQDHRVVITLDTVERLVYLKAASRNRLNTWDWLLDTLPAGRWGNVTLILAGRPEAEPLFHDLAEQHSGIQFIKKEVPEFDIDDREEYFKAVARAAAKVEGAYPVTQMIQGLIEKGLIEKYAALEGRPILLSLLIHALCLDAITGQYDADSSITSNTREILEQKIIQRLVQAPRIGATIVALGRLRKGADGRLLAMVLDCPYGEAVARLHEVKGLSFVKQRKDDGRYFLHDEMYTILDGHVYQTHYDEHDREAAALQISNYYKEKIEHLPANIIAYRNLKQKKVDTPINEREAWRFSNLLLEREEALVENLYYHLRHKPVRGFSYYYRYMRIAFRSADTNFGALLMADLLSYKNDNQAAGNSPGLDLPNELIEGELLLYPVFRRYFERDYSGCLLEIEDLLDNHTELFNPDDSLGLYVNLLIWKSYCLQSIEAGNNQNLNQAGKYIDEANERLSRLIQELEQKETKVLDTEHLKANARLWYLYATRALAAYIRASLSWSKGDLGFALQDYRASVNYWRYVDVLNEVAAATNDYAFALGEKGLYNTAYRMMMDSCLDLRRKYGTSYQAALSFNTLGSILMRQGKYNEAIEKSNIALVLAHGVADPRVEGLVLIALAEAHRRKATSGTIDQPYEQKKELLKTAREYARAAHSIFKDMQGQKLRRVEALIEVGCACRDLVRIERPGQTSSESIEITPEQKDLIDEGKEALKQAHLQASGMNTYREIDALVNQAWLGYYAGDALLRAQADASAMVELKKFTYPEQLKHKDKKVSPPPLFWTLLGKLYSLRGIIKMDEFYRCRREEGDWQPVLKQVARMFAEGLQYSARFSPEYLGLRQAEDSIYSRMMELNKHETLVVLDEIAAFENEIRQLPGELGEGENCLLYKLLLDHGLLPG